MREALIQKITEDPSIKDQIIWSVVEGIAQEYEIPMEALHERIVGMLAQFRKRQKAMEKVHLRDEFPHRSLLDRYHTDNLRESADNGYVEMKKGPFTVELQYKGDIQKMEIEAYISQGSQREGFL